MRIRYRLSLAFFVISVVPLAVVTAWSYYASATALRRAAEAQADQMAAEMGERMTFVLADLGDRVQRFWQDSSSRQRTAADAGAAGSAGQGTPRIMVARQSAVADPGSGVARTAAPVDGSGLLAQLQSQVSEALAEAAPIVERLEFLPAAPAPPLAPAAPAVDERPTNRRRPRPRLAPGGNDVAGPPPLPAHWFPPADRAAPARVVVDMRPAGPPPAGARPGVVAFTGPTASEMESWRRAVDQQMTLDREDERTATARGAGPSPAGGAPLGAAEMAARDAKRQQRRAEFRARMKALAAGDAVRFSVKMDGAVVGEVNARVNRHRMIETVLGLARRERGEVPFVLDIDDEIHTVGAEDTTLVERLGLDRKALAKAPGQSSRTIGDWVVVTRHDESGMVFGTARPLADSLRDIRRSALSSLGLGLLLILASFAVIVPLASSMTRPVTRLTDGVRRLAGGERGTRVPASSSDEVGELARAFNQMAGELEAHEKMLVTQERLHRELELCRQIQVDMLPREPLRLGLADVSGVSIPAREVGGDFFNYFALPGGVIALIVGDVSGKGVGAALLMANIQATLRAKLPLEHDLPTLVDALDRDVAANTPNEVYLTLFVAVLDPVRGLMRYVNAGHNPQYLLRGSDNVIEALDATGLPVGILPGHGYEQRSTRVHTGDLLFLYTDGATEVENEHGDMFGHERLQAALAQVPKSDAAGVLASVERVIRDFRGVLEPADDATMMAVRVGE